jgi:hypothetical protein
MGKHYGDGHEDYGEDLSMEEIPGNTLHNAPCRQYGNTYAQWELDHLLLHQDQR